VWRLLFAATEVTQTAEGAAEQSAPPPANPLTGMLPMIVIFFAIMYFLMIRPQQKREKERRAMLAAVAKGDAVITTGGICGTVVGLTEDRVVLRVDEKVTMEFVRGAIAQVMPKESAK
jgi:preprotein translocase subunit YajC